MTPPPPPGKETNGRLQQGSCKLSAYGNMQLNACSLPHLFRKINDF